MCFFGKVGAAGVGGELFCCHVLVSAEAEAICDTVEEMKENGRCLTGPGCH